MRTTSPGSRRSRPARRTSSGARATSRSPATTCASSRRRSATSRARPPPSTPGSHTSFVRREPIGVVGQVSPWNYPLWMAIWKIGPALAAGNSIVLKPASATPLTTIRLAELALEAGVPAGVLNVVTGRGRCRRRGDRRAHGRRPHLADRRHGDRQADPGPRGRRTSSGSISSSAARRRSSSAPTPTSRRPLAARRPVRSSTAGRTARPRPGRMSSATSTTRSSRGPRSCSMASASATRSTRDRPRDAHQRHPGRARRRLRRARRRRRCPGRRRWAAPGRPRLARRRLLPADAHRRLRPRTARSSRTRCSGPCWRCCRSTRSRRRSRRRTTRRYGLAASIWTSNVFTRDGGGADPELRPRPGQRPPHGDVRDAAWRVQAVRVRQGHVDATRSRSTRRSST